MKAITIKKLEISEIEVLQQQINNFISYKNAGLSIININDNEYFNTLLLLDISHKIYFNFRSRIEKATSNHSNIKMSIAEAITVIQIASFKNTMRNDFEKFTMSKITNIIHQELTNLN